MFVLPPVLGWTGECPMVGWLVRLGTSASGITVVGNYVAGRRNCAKVGERWQKYDYGD